MRQTCFQAARGIQTQQQFLQSRSAQFFRSHGAEFQRINEVVQELFEQLQMVREDLQSHRTHTSSALNSHSNPNRAGLASALRDQSDIFERVENLSREIKSLQREHSSICELLKESQSLVAISKTMLENSQRERAENREVIAKLREDVSRLQISSAGSSSPEFQVEIRDSHCRADRENPPSEAEISSLAQDEEFVLLSEPDDCD